MGKNCYSIINIFYSASPARFPAELLLIELNSGIRDSAFLTDDKGGADIIFELSPEKGRDDFSVSERDGAVILSASGVRGFIYAAGRLLRKLTVTGGEFHILPAVYGDFSPYKRIRGHQLGYRTTANSYEAWTFDEYEKYCTELMYFGMNTAEHIPPGKGSRRNALMKYDPADFLVEMSRRASKTDLDISVWHPNDDGETDESAARERGAFYAKLERLDHVFVPGGDPGELPAKEFVSRCRAISKALKVSHPGAEFWASAQAPHSIENWGEEFIEAMSQEPDEIDGVIYGPNHAFPLEELRRRLPAKYPLRFYPDITHNVRCEYPVHFDKNDWHYALTACLSRECTNPRPKEYERLFHLTEKYFTGSVSYSEGINDDVNKCVWSALEYDRNATALEAVEDYCRLFFRGAPCEKIAELIFAFEENWQGDPAENKGIETTLDGFENIAGDYPFLMDNFRFVQLYLRAMCDALIRRRLISENGMIKKARELFNGGKYAEALPDLYWKYPGSYYDLRQKIELAAKRLFITAGLQTDVKRYLADSWERGAVLETIDLPVTDRDYISQKAAENPFVNPLLFIDRDCPRGCVYHYSVARDGVPDKQSGEPYFNFQGDRPSVNDGALPVSLFNVFDNFTFVHTVRGVTPGNYTLRAVYLDKRDGRVSHHRVKAGNTVVYDGPQFGEPDEEFDHLFGHEGFVSALYDIPAGAFENGELRLEFSEPVAGIMIAELFLLEQAD